MTMTAPPPVDPTVITDAGGKYIRTVDDRIVEYSVHGNTADDDDDVTVLVSAYVADYLLVDTDTSSTSTIFDYGDKIKAITVSIPGLGHSSFHPGHQISQWPVTDLAPILEKENITGSFLVWGLSLGTLYAMAMAQHFGDRVQALGLRVPYLPLLVSQEAGLVNGQPSFPTTSELCKNTFTVKVYRFFLNRLSGVMEPGPWTRWCMKKGFLGTNMRTMACFLDDYPAESMYLQRLMKHFGPESMLYAMAKDVALDCPGLDPRQILLPCSKIVVWYATDDADCPPSHGKWLVDIGFPACRSRTFTGYGHVGGAFLEMKDFFAELMECL
jgi:pimeloyl-ACP methyl ester carboxylesterase